MRFAAIDTNLLLILIVGHVSIPHIKKHKRLRGYGPQDYDLLVNVLEKFQDLRVVTHAMAEVSNLLVYGVHEPLRSRFLAALKVLVESGIEHHIPSDAAAGHPDFLRVGLTDAAWLESLDSETFLLTDDALLLHAALSRDLQAVRFSDLRSRFLV